MLIIEELLDRRLGRTRIYILNFVLSKRCSKTSLWIHTLCTYDKLSSSVVPAYSGLLLFPVRGTLIFVVQSGIRLPGPVSFDARVADVIRSHQLLKPWMQLILSSFSASLIERLSNYYAPVVWLRTIPVAYSGEPRRQAVAAWPILPITVF